MKKILLLGFVFLIILSINTIAGTNVINDNVIGAWNFDQDSTTIAEDVHTGNNNITMTSYTHPVGIFGNGSDGYGRWATNWYANQTEFSFNFWINGENAAALHYLLSSGDAGTDPRAYAGTGQDLTIELGGYGTLTVPVNDALTHMISFTYSDTTDNATMWLDSNKVSSITVSGQMNDYGGLYLGSFQSSTDFWAGIIDEFVVFNTSLNNSDISELYNSSNGELYPYYYVPEIEKIEVGYESVVYENYTYNFNITFENYNLTTDTQAQIYFNGEYYNTDIHFYNSSFVVYDKNFSIPISYLNNSANLFNWNYTLVYTNTSNYYDITTNYTYYTYWDLNQFPRINITAYDLIAAAAIDYFTINDSNVVLSTTNGDLFFYVNGSQTNYPVTITNTSYEKKTALLNFTSGVLGTYQFQLYTTNSVNFTFYNEITNTEITDQNVTVEFISTYFSYNYTSDEGRLYVDLLSPADYTIRYQAETYGRLREYMFTLTNESHTDLTLFLLPDGNSTETTITVYDKSTLTPVEGAVIYLMRYFQTENVYKTVAMYSSDVSGKAYFDIEHDEELYKFQVDYPLNTLKLLTNPLYVSETSLNLYIQLTETAGTDYVNRFGITGLITYDNSTETFDLTYSDPGSVADEYCFYLKKYGQYSQTVVNSSCSSANTGSIDLTGLTENTTYYAVFTADINNEEVVLLSGWIQKIESPLNSGTFGIWVTAILVMIMVFMAPFGLMTSILAGLGLVFAQMLGFLSISAPTAWIIFIVNLVIAIFLNTKK